MRQFDEACLTTIHAFSANEIKALREHEEVSFLRKKVPCKCSIACSVSSGNYNNFLQCLCRCDIDTYIFLKM